MNKWEKPELITVGVENTKTEEYKPGGGNPNNPDDCYCGEAVDWNNHAHGSQEKWCDCCAGKVDELPPFQPPEGSGLS